MRDVGSGSIMRQGRGTGRIAAASLAVLLLLVLAFAAFTIVQSGTMTDAPGLVRFIPGGIDRERTVPADQVLPGTGANEYSPSGGARGERHPSGGSGGTVGGTGGTTGGPTGPGTGAPGSATGGSR